MNNMKRRGLFLSLLLAPLIGRARRQESKTISTPEGAITITSKMVPPVPQEFVPLQAEKLQQIAELERTAMDFLSAYNQYAAPSLEAYDAAFRRWQLDRASLFSVDDVVARLGAYLGCLLVKDLEMEWVQVTDAYGTDLAVRARKYEVTSFPFSSVMKRIQNEQYDFMAGVYYAVQDMIASGPMKR